MIKLLVFHQTHFHFTLMTNSNVYKVKDFINRTYTVCADAEAGYTFSFACPSVCPCKY